MYNYKATRDLEYNTCCNVICLIAIYLKKDFIDLVYT